MGFILSDIITDMERIADHCSNIAVCVVQVLEDAYDNHSYLDYIKNTDNEEFDKVVYELEQKYLLP